MVAKRTFHWAWVILVVCAVNLFVSYSVRLGYGVVLPEMIRTLGFGRTAGGSIYNSYLLTYIAVTPLTGYLTDRLGARRVITVCLLIFGFGVFLMGSAYALTSVCTAIKEERRGFAFWSEPTVMLIVMLVFSLLWG